MRILKNGLWGWVAGRVLAEHAEALGSFLTATGMDVVVLAWDLGTLGVEAGGRKGQDHPPHSLRSV